MTFPAAIASLPAQIPWLDHGRDPAVGLDCVGLCLWVYAQVGQDMGRLDMPYIATDIHKAHRVKRILDRMLSSGEFALVPQRTPDGGLSEWLDGDIVILRRTHLGIFVGGKVWHMSERGLDWRPGSCARVEASAVLRANRTAAGG
jgi:cell wall-associated NlpC family hydrolase